MQRTPELRLIGIGEGYDVLGRGEIAHQRQLREEEDNEQQEQERRAEAFDNLIRFIFRGHYSL